MLSIFLFFLKFFLCTYSETTYWFFFECNSSNLSRRGAKSEPETIHFNDLELNTEEADSSLDNKLMYGLLDFTNRNITEIQNKVKNKRIKQEDGTFPHVLKVKCRPLYLEEIQELKSHGVVVCRIFDENGESHTFLDIKRSDLLISAILSTIIETGRKSCKIGVSVPKNVFFTESCCFLIVPENR